MLKLYKDIQNLTKTEKKVLYEIFYKGSLVYLSEKQVREKLGRKSSVHALLNGLAEKDFLHVWENAEKKGINLYHFSDRIRRNSKNKSKLIEEIRPKYFCNSCQKYHYIDSDMGRRHKRNQAKPKKTTTSKPKKVIFKPNRTNMQKIGERCERFKFPLKMERQGDEWIARLNYDRSQSINGISYYASIIHKEMGSERKPVLDVLCGLQTVSGKFDKSFFKLINEYNKKLTKKYDDMGLRVFGKKVKIYVMKTNPNKTQITFSCRIDLTDKDKLTAKERDFISDFMHGVFGLFRQKQQLHNIR